MKPLGPMFQAALQAVLLKGISIFPAGQSLCLMSQATLFWQLLPAQRLNRAVRNTQTPAVVSVADGLRCAVRRKRPSLWKAILRLMIAATMACLALPMEEGLARQPENASQPIDAGSQSQLFVDRYLIASEKAIELVVHPPRKMERVLVPGRPWEAYRVSVQCVLRDGDVYRMYYSCIPSKPAGKGETIRCRNCRREVPDNTVVCQCGWCPSSELQQRMFGNLAYAESQDGIHWEKPALGLREFDGDKSNNLLPNAGPVVSMVAKPVRGMRFLSLPATDDIIRLSGSRDGRTFGVLAEGLSPFLLDTANQILWDPNREKYVAYLRGFSGRRVVVRVEMDDPTKTPWPHNEGADLKVEKGSKYVTTELSIVMDGNKLGTYEIYNPALSIYPHRKGGVYLAFPTVYRAYPHQPGRPHHNYNKAPNDGMAEIYLLVSRDGKNFTIPAKTAYLSPGTEDEPDRGYLSMAVGIIEKGDELWQYYTGVEVTHGVVDPDRRGGMGGTYRLVQKRDRFAGARAGHAGGEIVTPPLVFSGNRLEVNVDCGGLGEAWVEILDEAGQPIPGFEMDRFDVLDRNQIHAPCAWMENRDVGQLAGRPVKLRFKLRAATLYSFRFFK